VSRILLRVALAALFGLLGLAAAWELTHHTPPVPALAGLAPWLRNYALPAVGLIVGVAVSPLLARLFELLVVRVEESVAKLAPAEALSGAIGLVVGLIVSALVREIFNGLSLVPRYGPLISFSIYALITLFFSYAGVRVGLRHRVASWVRGAGGADVPAKLLDTSVIVDGRILEISEAGFLEGRLLVPRFVLKELQAIADSSDSLKRVRGRRGLEVLNRLRDTSANLEICDNDASERDVDGKLVSVARELHAQIVTTDYNLNRVARLQGVNVLNVNELANGLKSVVLPGEDMSVAIVKDGKEQHQGVGYLDDGTMIVIENGRALIGETVGVQVTSILQTAAGRMIFAKVKQKA